MICLILVANPAGEYVMDNWVGYSGAINNCNYFNSLFNGKSIVMDRFTVNYIDYNNIKIILYKFFHNNASFLLRLWVEQVALPILLFKYI